MDQGRHTPFLFSLWSRADTLLFCSLYGSGHTHSFSVLSMDQGRLTPCSLYRSGQMYYFLFSLWVKTDALLLCSFYGLGHTHFFSALSLNQVRRTPFLFSPWIRAYTLHNPFLSSQWIREEALLFCSLFGAGHTHSFSVLCMDQGIALLYCSLWIKPYALLFCSVYGSRHTHSFLFSVWIKAYALIFCSFYGSGQTHSFLVSLQIMADALILCFTIMELVDVLLIRYCRSRRTAKTLLL
jgi:hypothetical protein